MSVLTAPRQAAAPAADAAPPTPLRWTRAEYYRLAEAGFFAGRRVMLIDGEVFVMSPQNNPHVTGIALTKDALEAIFGSGFWVRTQAPLDLGQTSDPEPDVAVVVGAPRTFKSHPTSALLVVEVADSSVSFDTGRKASLYAAGGIADYWVVDLGHNQLHVFRDPHLDPSAYHGFSYTSHTTHGPAEAVAPRAAPTSPVKVADLLP
ncbi:MAG: Uma2 family endonuclease [Gemmataceae bacterium]|nr:Uma2 family endonuclease [Gemmataceae bacterium]